MAAEILNPFGDGADDLTASGCTLVIFGVTGDLTRNKLVPALFSLFENGFLDRSAIIGFARRPWSDADFRREVVSMLSGEQAKGHHAEDRGKTIEAFLKLLTYVSATFEDPAGYDTLAALLENGAAEGRPTVLYYLATAPESYATVVAQLGRMRSRHSLSDVMRDSLVVEKPFGRDGGSARALDESIHAVFPEESVYRIDHYVGKETVQNILAFRFGNGMFEPIWNAASIDRIEITVAESAGVGTRAGYYEHSGALRDMVQNHMFQLLALTAMECPNNLDAASIRAEKLKVFRAVRPFDPTRIESDTVRAQYEEGTIDGQQVRAYRTEAGVTPDSVTETFAAFRIWIDTWRWSGVPFYLRVGKRLPARQSEIVVYFRKPPINLFPRPGVKDNVLVFRIQPDEGFSLSVNTKIPGFSSMTRPATMDFSYGSGFADAPRDAYERLLLDAFRGDMSLYTSSEEVAACWKALDPVLGSWSRGIPPLAFYTAGTSGPDAARELLTRDGWKWRKM